MANRVPHNDRESARSPAVQHSEPTLQHGVLALQCERGTADAVGATAAPPASPPAATPLPPSAPAQPTLSPETAAVDGMHTATPPSSDGPLPPTPLQSTVTRTSAVPVIALHPLRSTDTDSTTAPVTAVLGAAPLQAATERTHAEMCCGIGGAHVGLASAHLAGLNVTTTMAWDNSERVLRLYKRMHTEVSDVRCCELDADDVTASLVSTPPDLMTMTVPCGDYSTAGKGVEGQAAACTERAAAVVCNTGVPLAMIVNVVPMLTSKSWQRARAQLQAVGYDVYVSKWRGTDCGMACSRRRVYIVICPHTAENTRRLARYGALMNMLSRLYTADTVSSALRMHETTLFWQPRDPTHAGVLPADGPLPSPVTRHPGAAPASTYTARSSDGPRGRSALALRSRGRRPHVFRRALPARNSHHNPQEHSG